MQEALDEHAPYKNITIPPGYNSALSEETKQFIKGRNQLHGQMMAAVGQERRTMWEAFRKQRNKCNNLVKRDVKRKTQEKIGKANNMSKEVWNIVKNIRKKKYDECLKLYDSASNTHIEDPKMVSKIMNDFFVDKITNL